MLIAAFGAPTRYFDLCKLAATHIFKHIYEDLISVETSNFSKFRSDILMRKAASVLYLAEKPEPNILNTLVRHKVPCVIFGEQPISAINSIRALHDLDYLSAVRTFSGHYAAIEPLTEYDYIKYIMENTLNDDILNLVQAIADAYEVNIRTEDLYAIAHNLADSDPNRSIYDYCWRGFPAPPSRKPEQDFHMKDVDAIDFTFPPIDVMATRGWGWAPRLFYAINNQNSADCLIELTGKSRTLIFGPYLFLPQGAWLATYHLNVVQNGSGNTILADILGNLDVLAVGKLALPKEGSFEFSLSFNVREIHESIEIRLHTLEGAIGGYIELVSVKFSRN